MQISLDDENDNPPVFSRAEYTVTVFETIAVGTNIVQLFSSDADIGINAESYYYKIPNSGDYLGEMGSIIMHLIIHRIILQT